jgi:hypothetical protein
MIWRARRLGVPRRQPSVGWVKLSLLAALLLLVTACAPGMVSSLTPAARHSATQTAIPAATRTAAEALSHIHNASPRFIPLFASVTFTVDTTYDQATAILRGHVYPWTCDEPRSNEPPSPAVQQTNFAAWHGLLMSYPVWDELERIASSPQVISVEGTALYPCP